MKHAAIENFIKYVIQPMGVAAFAILAGLVVTVAMEAGAESMLREDTPYLLLTKEEGPLFRKTLRSAGMVTAFEVLEEIGRTTTDTAANKQFLQAFKPATVTALDSYKIGAWQPE